MKFRIGLFQILLIVLLSAAITAILTRKTYHVTEIQIVENNLVVKADGTIEGHLTWCVSEESETADTAPIVICNFKDYVPPREDAESKILSYKRGDEIAVRSIVEQFYFDPEHPYEVFLVRYLGIKAEKISGVRNETVAMFNISG